MSNFSRKPDLITVRALQSESDPSLLSRNTGNSGPSKIEPALITSKWTIGWQTPTLMLTSYGIALAIAVAHLVLFQYIDGKEADGPNRIAPQAYITTASNILANSFGFALRASLAVAFCQYLWRLFRVQAMKVSTIELLYAIRTNPFQLFRLAVLRATPTLCALAALMWVSQVVTSFPPGAISVTSTQTTSFSIVEVPFFNASFMGNGSGVDANAYSLVALAPSDISDGFTSGVADTNKNNNLINRLARQILIAGDSFSMPSPCGVNCSYLVEFEGPYMTCNTSTTMISFDRAADLFPIYTGQWIAPIRQSLNPALKYNGTHTQARFNSTTLFPIQANGTNLNGPGNGSSIMQQDSTICEPGRAKYIVNNTYLNNIHTRNVSVQPIEKLTNLVLQTKNNAMRVPGFRSPEVGKLDLGTAPANWSTEALNFYRDNNMMTIFGSLMSWLNGTFLGFLADGEGRPVLGFEPPAYPSYLLKWNEEIRTTLSTGLSISMGAQEGTVIDSTRFNDAFGHYSPFESSHPSFNITQDLLNDYLFNMTVSMMMAYGTWRTTATATKFSTITVYSFSQPLSLLLPYFVTLFASLPFLVIGTLALFKNGVSAMDGSFTQIITTSTGSAILDQAAAGGCLGGDESMPQELKDLKIKYGEFIGREDPGRIKRAGFGVEGEVTPLEKGANYGIARWI